MFFFTFMKMIMTVMMFSIIMKMMAMQEAHAGGKALKDAGYKFDVAHTSVLQVTYLVFSSFFVDLF